MKKLRQFCFTYALTFVLAIPAFAGEISFPGVTSSTPQQQSSVTGEISFPGATATGEISGPGVAELDPMMEAVLGLFQGLISLF